MYVEEVCIEGFKSYAQRTVVPAFDPLFNAITGLNGSGKSNILDSICFVLGITNHNQVDNFLASKLFKVSGQQPAESPQAVDLKYGRWNGLREYFVSLVPRRCLCCKRSRQRRALE